MRTYADNTHWLAYQPFFPERARLSLENAPEEQEWSWRGASIHLDRYACPDAKLKVILLHGAGANGRIMGAFGTILRDHGYASVAPDLPGYGMTDAPRSLVDVRAWVDAVSDLVDAELERDGLPVVLFGASLGGMLTYQVACRNPRVSGIIATTLADPSEPSTGPQLAVHPLLATVGGVFMNALSVVLDPLPVPIRWVSKMNHISNQPEMVKALIADRSAAGSVVPLRFLRTFMGTSPDMAPEDFDVCPVLLVHPEQDFMTPLAMSTAFYERLAGDKRFVLLTGAGHMPLETPGIDLLQDAVLTFLTEQEHSTQATHADAVNAAV